MEEQFKIYVERLNEGKVEYFDFRTSPQFLDVQDLVFKGEVHVKGKAYLAEHELVLHAEAESVVLLPCQICNELTEVEITVRELVAIYPHEEVKSGIFDMSPLLREEILLQVPQFIECHQGKCPERGSTSSYMSREHEGYQPFKEL
jgi:uncharacterized metal-binding protein YceD (DUF177 family)